MKVPTRRARELRPAPPVTLGSWGGQRPSLADYVTVTWRFEPIEQMSNKVWIILGVAALGLMLGVVASIAHAADTNLRLVQAPSPRREIDLGEIRSWDSARCRQAKEDVKVLDGRLNGPEFADIPTQAEYDLGYGWEREGAGLPFKSSGPTGRERALETWGENSRQFKEGEAANEKYKDFNRRAPRTFSKPDLTSFQRSITDFKRLMDEYNKVPPYTYATPESERLWKLFEQRIKIQDTRRGAYATMLSICYPTPNPLQDLEDRVRKLEEMPR